MHKRLFVLNLFCFIWAGYRTWTDGPSYWIWLMCSNVIIFMALLDWQDELDR